MAPPLPKRLAAEAVGTFGFFFTVYTAASHDGVVPIAAGFGLMLMIAAFGHISGGHFNPAVTLGLAIGKKHPMAEVVPYWAAQVAGGIVAALAAVIIYAHGTRDKLVISPGDPSSLRALVVELIATAFFLLVVSAVATDAKAPWNGVLAPVLIGLFIFTAATVFGGISGGAFNPAIALAPAIVALKLSDVWIYLIGPLAGGAIGGYAYAWFRADA